MTEQEYAEKFAKYMNQFPHGWDEYPVRVARCTVCEGLTLNPKYELCACGNKLHEITRLMLPGTTYYPGSSGGDESRQKFEGPKKIVLSHVPYKNA